MVAGLPFVVDAGQMAPTRRRTEAWLGKMNTPAGLSPDGFVDSLEPAGQPVFDQCTRGNAVRASTSALASSSIDRSWEAVSKMVKDRVPRGRDDGRSDWAKIVRNTAATMS